MKAIYRCYEANQGLEELGARIYTEVTGLSITPEQIQALAEDIDPKFMRFALTEAGEPLAYVSARESGPNTGTISISFPWALPSCLSDIQDTLFMELFTYLKRLEHTREIITKVVLAAKNAKEQVRFFQEKGFIEKERFYYYHREFAVEEVGRWPLTDEIKGLTSRAATSQDIDQLVDVCHSDPNLTQSFPTKAAWKSYLKDRVLKDGHVVLVLKGKQVVAAGAPFRFTFRGQVHPEGEERTILRFAAIRPGHLYNWKRLLIEIAKECVASGITDLPLHVGFGFSTRNIDDVTTHYAAAAILAELLPEITTEQIILSYRVETR